MKNYYLSLLILALTFQAWSQEEDESCLPPDKKVEKLLIKASNAPDAQTAVGAFNEAI